MNLPPSLPPWTDDGKERPNILICVIDTLRRDATTLGDPEVTAKTAPMWPSMPGGMTPNLNEMAKHAAVFTNAYSASPWTVPSHASIFTGMLPIAHNCVARTPRLGPVGPTIAELCARVGYETAAFFSNPWLSDRATGLLRGFAIKQEATIGDLATMTGAEGDQGGAETLRNVDAYLAGRTGEKPFMMFVNLLEAHLPYAPTPIIRSITMPPLHPTENTSIQWSHEYNARLHPEDEVDWPKVRGLYAGDVRYADELFGVLMQVLDKHKLLKDTIIIVTSDHGENLGEHGRMEHQFSLHETVLAVPLMVRAPGGEIAEGRYSEPVMTTDIYATVADLALADQRPKEGRMSVPLMRTAKIKERKRERAVYGDYMRPHTQLLDFALELNPELDLTALDRAFRTVRVGPMRLTAASDGEVLLHNMLDDPLQETDISEKHKDMLAGLSNLLVQAQPKTPAPQAAPHTMDKKTQDQLKGLGYAPGGDEDE